MSYCRFSSLNFMSDVYVYESEDGWVTHVASNRLLFPPLPPFPRGLYPDLKGRWDQATKKVVYPNFWYAILGGLFFGAVAKWERLRTGVLRKIPRRAIKHRHAGKMFADSTPLRCAIRLRSLRHLGFVVPQYAIDALEREAPDLLGEMLKKDVDGGPSSLRDCGS
jgi:hypothetical protein